MTVEEKLKNLREQWKWATPQRKRTIELLAKSLKIKAGYKEENREITIKDVKETLF